MKREDVKNKIPGITEEQLNWLMQENGSDVTREKSAAAALQTQLNSAQAPLKTAQDGLKAFDGVDVAGLQAQVTKLQADMQAQADGFAFDSALNTAILGKKGRSVDAVRALLPKTAPPTSTRRWRMQSRPTLGRSGSSRALHSRVPAPTPPAANTATPCTAVTIPTRWRPPLKT